MADEKTLVVIEPQDLTKDESQEVAEAFQTADDFRTVGERITAPLDDILTETSEVIDRDPIMRVSDELSKMNGDVQEVYSEIIDNDGLIMRLFKALPLVGHVAKGIDAKFDETKFNVKGIEGKITTIFSGFDTTYNSVNTSINMQKEFLDGIDANLGKVIAYKNFIEEKMSEFETNLEKTDDEDEKVKLSMFLRNVQFFQGNLVVLIGNLEMARKRLLMRLDAANKLSLAMNSSRPIFKTLLSTAIIETASQKAIDASMKAMDAMGSTIDKMSSELTDRAIESSRETEEVTSKPILSTTVFIENVTKLKNHFDEIDTFRAKVAEEATAERKLFDDATTKLKNIKILNKKDTEELAKELMEGVEM